MNDDTLFSRCLQPEGLWLAFSLMGLWVLQSMAVVDNMRIMPSEFEFQMYLADMNTLLWMPIHFSWIAIHLLHIIIIRRPKECT